MDKKNMELKYKKRNVGIQTIHSKEYLMPSVAATHNLESVEYPKIASLPHNITALLVLCGLIYYLSSLSKGNMEEGLKQGIIGSFFSVIVFGCLYLPDSLLRRPHPIFWRIITSCTILYLLFITFVLFQSKNEALNLLSSFDKNLGKPLPDKNYAEKCELFTRQFPYLNINNISDSIDFYMVAHLVGWYVKMLIVRDVKICWFLSILFEGLEITFRHWLPNFWECWWDHAILDVFGMNALGIWLGEITCKYMEVKNYYWIKNENDKAPDKYKTRTLIKGLMKFLNYFTPNYWAKHEWKIFSNVKRFYAVIWFFILMNLVDLSHFFMKYILLIPPTHFFLQIRICLWSVLAMISTREYYEYISNEACQRIGFNCWLAHLVLFVEWAISLKFSENMFNEPFPFYVVCFWTIVFVALSAITIHLVVKDFMAYIKMGKNKKSAYLIEPEIDIEYVKRDIDTQTE